jgi:hypothetical protein
MFELTNIFLFLKHNSTVGEFDYLDVFLAASHHIVQIFSSNFVYIVYVFKTHVYFKQLFTCMAPCGDNKSWANTQLNNQMTFSRKKLPVKGPFGKMKFPPNDPFSKNDLLAGCPLSNFFVESTFGQRPIVKLFFWSNDPSVFQRFNLFSIPW